MVRFLHPKLPGIPGDPAAGQSDRPDSFMDHHDLLGLLPSPALGPAGFASPHCGNRHDLSIEPEDDTQKDREARNQLDSGGRFWC